MADYKNPIKVKAAGRGVQWLADCKIPRPLRLAIASGQEIEIEADWVSGMILGSYEEISKAKPKRKPKKVRAKAEEVTIEVDAGADGKFGTEDDVVSVVEESQKEKEAPAEPKVPKEPEVPAEEN
tara:strand:+ start:503 stop:877 length:375 start_codon:yes stop_codon:yes gene_type:complete